MQNRRANWHSTDHEPTTVQPDRKRIKADLSEAPTWRDFRLICAAILLRAEASEQPRRSFVVSDLWPLLWQSETVGLLADSHHMSAHLSHLAGASGGAALTAIGEDEHGQTVWAIRDLGPVRRGAQIAGPRWSDLSTSRAARTVLREAWADRDEYLAELDSQRTMERLAAAGIVSREPEPAPFMADLFE